MKKIIKMFSAVILLVLINQNVVFASYVWIPSEGVSATSCISPCQALAGPDQFYCPLCPVPVVLGAQPHSSDPISAPGGCTATYAWAPGGMTTEHPSVSPTATTTYTLTVTFTGACACDASNCMTCTRTDQIGVTVATCNHCGKIINPLFDPEVNNICSNGSLEIDPNPLTNMFGIIRNKICDDVANRPKKLIIV